MNANVFEYICSARIRTYTHTHILMLRLQCAQRIIEDLINDTGSDRFVRHAALWALNCF